MAVTATDAIVLQCFAYGETSRIVRLLTRTAGLQSAIAKGALRPRSRYSVLEPFTQGVASLYIKASRELQTLGGFELTRSRQALGSDLLRFGGASLLAELVLRTGSEEPNAGLFDSLAVALDQLMDAPADVVEVTVLALTWQLVAILGFEPELDACIVCGRHIAPRNDVSFDYGAGGVRCDACAAGLPGRRIPAHARAALHDFLRGDLPRVRVTEGHWRLLSRYLDHHLLEGAPLRSLHFLASSLGVR